MSRSTITGDVTFTGKVKIADTCTFSAATTGVSRGELDQDNNQIYELRPEDWRVWNAHGSLLPSTPLTDDLGCVSGTWGTDTPSVQTEDLKNAGANTSYARRVFTLPPEYVDGETVTLRFRAGMKTTAASASATLDVECYKTDKEGAVSGSDLCTTAATDINSTTLADRDFTITPTGLAAGDQLDIRIALAVNDSGTATAVIGLIGFAAVLLDVKG